MVTNYTVGNEGATDRVGRFVGGPRWRQRLGSVLVTIVVAACGAGNGPRENDVAGLLRQVGRPVHPDRAEGWEDLGEAVGGADAVFLGEWHGVRENATAARRVLTLVEVRTLALEIGAEASRDVEQAVSSGGVDALAARWREDPYSVPFLWWQEEAELVEGFLATGPGKRLAGFDREFPWSARFLLRSLEAGAKAEGARLADSVTVLRRAAEAGFQPFLDSGDASGALLSVEGPERFDRLAGAAREAGWPAGARRLSRMAVAARLEAGLQVGSRQANLERVGWMKELLTEHLAEPRVVVKTGLQHAARGRNLLGYTDLGGLIEADLGPDATLHVAVLPASGMVNAWMPGQPATARNTPFDGVARMAGQVDLRPFVDAAAEGGPWTLFDLRGLRAGAFLPPEVNALAARFDFLILIHRALPATFFTELGPDGEGVG